MTKVLAWITANWSMISLFLLFVLSELKGEMKDSKYGSVLYGPLKNFLQGGASEAKPAVDKVLNEKSDV